MEWSDIAGIVFASVTANHLGLVKAIEETYDHELPIINCVKCLTFWAVLVYMVFTTRDVITSLAISFLASYSAIWVELLEAYIDTLYLKLYGKIYETSDDTTTSDADNGNTSSTVSELQQDCKINN